MSFDQFKISDASLEKLIDKHVEVITKDEKFCSHLQSLGFDLEAIKENISFIIDYYEDYKVCINCKDPLKCALGEHYIKKVTYENGLLNFEYDLCAKYKKINRAKNLSTICDIPDSFLAKSLASDLDKHNVRSSFLTTMLDIHKNKTSKNVFVHSNKRSGGTYLTSLFYKEIITKHSMSGAYLQGQKRLSELADMHFNNKTEFNRRMEELKTVEFLVINKISNYNFNEYIRNNVLFPILEARISNGLTTILTSELSYEDFLAILNVKNSSKDVRFTQIKNLLDEFEKLNISLNVKYY